MKNQESIKFQENQKKKGMKIGTSQKNPIKKKETNENFKKSMFYKNYCRHIHIGFIF